ncbi:NUDIX hydrolase [Candidatus Magnetominusculus dajiuhuensis]|uniref:NUDIX hydrolase n=1 Tax=Candidatus Magnetominusculus dajiuhuensis TaxID=3137712 RepID=UPI003B43302B
MPVKIIGKSTNWSGRFLQAVQFEVENSEGERFQWEAFQRCNCSGIAAIVPITKDGTVIVVRQFRPPVGKYVIEFPAGLNDKGQSLIEAARRELLEETGCRAGRMFPIATGPLSSGASTEVLTVYAALDVVFSAEQALDPHEDIEIIELPLDNFYEHLYALQDENTYIDLKLYGLLELAKRHLSDQD